MGRPCARGKGSEREVAKAVMSATMRNSSDVKTGSIGFFSFRRSLSLFGFFSFSIIESTLSFDHGKR